LPGEGPFAQIVSPNALDGSHVDRSASIIDAFTGEVWPVASLRVFSGITVESERPRPSPREGSAYIESFDQTFKVVVDCVPIAPEVRSQGFWKRVCSGSHPSGEHEKLPEYVDFVTVTDTFAGADSVAELCEILDPTPKNDKCSQAEAQFMALLLNVCSGRVARCNGVEDPDLGETTVGEVIDFIDLLLSDPERTRQDCELAQSLADMINNGLTLVH